MSFAWDFSLLAKISILLAAGLAFDGLLRRRWVLTTAALWNALLVAIVALPAMAWLVPQWELTFTKRKVSVIAQNGPINPPAQVSALPSQAPMAPLERTTPPMETSAAMSTPRKQLSPTTLREQSTASADALTLSGPTHQESLLIMLAGLYALGAMLALARLTFNWRAAHDLRRQAQVVGDSVWVNRFSYWRNRLSLTRGQIRLLHDPSIAVPFAVGWRDRTIILPTRLIEEASYQTIESVLLHELAHLARADYVWQLLQRVIQALLWFHPLSWWAARRMSFIRERACDEFVVHALGDYEAYCNTLLDMAARVAPRRQLALGMAAIRQGNLARRLESLKRSAGNGRCLAPWLLRWPLAMLILLGTGIIAGWNLEKAIGQETDSERARPKEGFVQTIWPIERAEFDNVQLKLSPVEMRKP